MCEVSVQIADLIIYHEAPPIGSCFHCWSCSNGSVHVLTWFKPFIQTVTSHSCTKNQTLVLSGYLGSNASSLDKINLHVWKSHSEW